MTMKIRTVATLSAVALVSFAIALPAFSQDRRPVPTEPPEPAEGVQYAAFHSPALGREMNFAIQLPPSYEKEKNRRYPLLVFLHGMNGNEGEFQRRGVAAAINRMREAGKIGEMIIAAPAGGNSFYMNAKNGARYEDAVVSDLVPYIEKNYRAIGKREGRAIQGLSMGGWGALMLAFKHPEMFTSVTAHSAALFLELPSTDGNDRRAQFLSRLIGGIFGDPPDEEFFRANNPLYLAESNAAALKKSGLKIYFDVGEQDRYGFQEPNRLFHERLTKAGIDHVYNVFQGGHGWEYMISVADHSYGFLWKEFNSEARPAKTGS